MGCLFYFLVTLTLATGASQTVSECGASFNSKNGSFSSLKNIFWQSSPCDWTIRVPDNYVVHLRSDESGESFRFFPLNSHRFYLYDVLHDGQLIFRDDWSYDKTPSPYISLTLTILIRFKRFGILQGAYRITFYWFVEEIKCGGSYSSTKGVFTSPSPISRNTVCKWTITVPENYRIRLIKKETFETVPWYTINFQVYNVLPDKQRILGAKWFVHEHIAPFTSSASTIDVEFRSYVTLDAQFSFSWSVVDKDEDLLMLDGNSLIYIGIGTFVAFVVSGFLMFKMGMQIEKRRNKSPRDHVMLRPSPSHDDTRVSLLQEANADEDNVYQSLSDRRRLQLQSYHEYEAPNAQRDNNDYVDIYDGYQDVIDSLSNGQRSGEVVPFQTPDFQSTIAPPLFDVIRGLNERQRQRLDGYESSSNKSNGEYLEVIDPLSNLFGQIPFQTPDYQNTTAYQGLEVIRGLNERQGQQLNGYESSFNESNGEYLEVINPLSNLFRQELVPFQTPDCQNATASPSLDVIRRLNERQRQQLNGGHASSSNESNEDCLDLEFIKSPQNLDKERQREVFPPQTGGKNETRVFQCLDDNADETYGQLGNPRQRHQFQDYKTPDSDNSVHVEAYELLQNPKPHKVLSLQSSAVHEVTSFQLVQESNIGNAQCPKACQQNNHSLANHYEDPEPLQIAEKIEESDTEYVMADEDYLAMLKETHLFKDCFTEKES